MSEWGRDHRLVGPHCFREGGGMGGKVNKFVMAITDRMAGADY